MKMTIISISLLIIFALWIGEVRVSLDPFSVELTAWRKLLGIVLVCAGVLFLNLHFRDSEIDRLSRQGKITINDPASIPYSKFER